MGEFVISNDKTNYIPNHSNEPNHSNKEYSMPKCFNSNGEPYPLCKGGEYKCHNCCLYENYEDYNSPY